MNHRARTNRGQKLSLIGVSAIPAATTMVTQQPGGGGRTGALLAVLAELKARENMPDGVSGVVAEWGLPYDCSMDYILFALFLAAYFDAGATGAVFEPGEWYDSLEKPGWTPPKWVFPVMWTTV